jgi:hypothetical protein
MHTNDARGRVSMRRGTPAASDSRAMRALVRHASISKFKQNIKPIENAYFLLI